jgi:hypothetical protein
LNANSINSICFSATLFLCCLWAFLPLQAQPDTDDFDIPVQIKFIRAFGVDDERKPPVIILPGKSGYSSDIGSEAISIEMDVSANIPPPLVAKFVHCEADWSESQNVFLNDIIYSRTTLFEWDPAPMHQNYFGYKARLTVPNQQVKFKFSGNWKAKIYDMDNDRLLAETRFFVVEPRAHSYAGMTIDFYKSHFKVTNTGLNIEAVVQTGENLIDGNVRQAAIYKNHRWFEPYFIADSFEDTLNNRYRYRFGSWVRGMVYSGKSFRIDGLPAENAYRILNLADLAYFPPGNMPVRFPFADLRRNGSFLDFDEDGAMTSYFTPPEYRDYALVDFVLEPVDVSTDNDIFVSGSFNNWNPDKSWLMNYDPFERNYKLRAWVPRARHNYLYASGKLDFATNTVNNLSYDEFEGNTTAGRQTYFVFFYYREFEYGGYDSIISVVSTSITDSYAPGR